MSPALAGGLLSSTPGKSSILLLMGIVQFLDWAIMNRSIINIPAYVFWWTYIILSVRYCWVVGQALVWKVKVKMCPILCDAMNCSPPGSFVHGILQARILEWVAISSRGSSQPREWTWVPCIAGRFFTIWATRGYEAGTGLAVVDNYTPIHPYQQCMRVSAVAQIHQYMIFPTFSILAIQVGV